MNRNLRFSQQLGEGIFVIKLNYMVSLVAGYLKVAPFVYHTEIPLWTEIKKRTPKKKEINQQ